MQNSILLLLLLLFDSRADKESSHCFKVYFVFCSLFCLMKIIDLFFVLRGNFREVEREREEIVNI